MRRGDALKSAKRKRIHIVIATSAAHEAYKLRMEPDEVLAAGVESVTLARNHADDVEWSAEDGTRSDIDFLCRCVEAAIKAARPRSICPTPSATRCPRTWSACTPDPRAGARHRHRHPVHPQP
jgi:2-isopropylmalate synthase